MILPINTKSINLYPNAVNLRELWLKYKSYNSFFIYVIIIIN